MEQITSNVTGTTRHSFFSVWDWSAFWIACLISLAVYFFTLAPTVTMEDCGELATAGAYLGVPHPPGYPIWTMMAWIFTKLFGFVTFRGQPNPAWCIALMSAFFGSLASGLTAMLICRSGSDIIQKTKGLTEIVSHSTESLFCLTGGIVGSLLFAFSPVNWSQCVIVEVYSLNAFFLVLVLVLAYMWIKNPKDHILVLLSFVFGIGLTNYMGLALLVPALAIVVLLKNVSLFRDFLVAGLAFIIILVLIKIKALPQLLHPAHFTSFIYLTLNFIVIILSYYYLPNGRTVALSIIGLEVGLTVYGYMPLASETNPPMNWGYPRTFDGFLHAVTRGQYEQISPTDPFSLLFIRQAIDYLKDVRSQYTLLVAPLAMLPFVTWELKLGSHHIRAIYLALPLFIASATLIFMEELINSTGIPVITYAYLTLLCIIAGIQFIGILTLFTTRAADFLGQLRDSQTPFSERLTILVLLLFSISVIILFEIILSLRFATVLLPLKHMQAILPGQLINILGKAAGLLLIIFLPILVIPAGRLYRGKSELRLNIDTDSQKWIVATLCSFLVMSLLFMILANPKGDIQDYFIQRVKFISSHALYSFWIGYGIIFGLTIMTSFARGNNIVKWSGIAISALLPLIPIEENARNREQIRIVGGAEQNGHDFGWQFGNYQLRGADAINEELNPNEEPLPNPSYPPEMGTNAVFFGGTDPGRFVPTYMIYSARVRKDVYLITQNALADGTYMNVMRDLYGDRIWIPSLDDNSNAFKRYVDDVQSGRRPPNADIKIAPDGHVKISGSMGVMEINGVLAQMIFEHNNYKHDFYVEESYPLRWMYSFMEPHGLIMKINRNTLPRISDERTHDDSDFWDWYTRRLSANKLFIRDIVARKSFAKLRCAIAGLYIFCNERRAQDAERAFNDARILYPIWPEGVFRLAELYMTEGRFTDARRLVSTFSRQDPGNNSGDIFLNQLNRVENLNRKIRNIENLTRTMKLTAEDAFELSDSYSQLGQVDRAISVINNILAATNLPAGHCLTAAKIYNRFGRVGEMNSAIAMCTNRLSTNNAQEVLIDIAGLYAQTGQFNKMAEILKYYLKTYPDDWKAWLDLATLQIEAKQTADATMSIERAARRGGAQAVKVINNNPRLNNFMRAAKP